MKMVKRILLASFFLLMPILAFGEEGVLATNAEMSWMEFLALTIDSFVVVGVVWLLTRYMPVLKEKVGWLLPMISMGIGPFMVMLTNALSEALGYPVDLSPIAGVFVGGSATALHQFRKQIGTRKRLQMSKVFPLLPLAFVLGTATPGSALDLKGFGSLSVGGGSFFADEDTTFSINSFSATVQWQGLSLPGGVNAGVGLEGSKETFTLWSLNRRKIAGSAYGGMDMKIFAYGKADYDLRIVTGTVLSNIGRGKLVLEVYALEENRPLSFAFLYAFQ